MEFRQRVVSYYWALFITYITAVDSSLQELERHMDLGKQFLAKGQFSDALTHYNAATDMDPDNYQARFRRATTFLAMGKSKQAVPDLNHVIKLKPDFSAARLQRGNVFLKQGNLKDAKADFEQVLINDANNAEALQKLSLIGPTSQNIELANHHFAQGEFEEAEFYLSKVVELCPWDPSLRDKRASCYEQIGRIQDAISDVRASTKLVLDSTGPFYQLCQLYYRIGDTEESLNTVRECLKLNPDHKLCFPHYKKVKKLFKLQNDMREATQKEQWQECIDKAKKVVQAEPNVLPIHINADTCMCKCHVKAGQVNEALSVCSEVLEYEENLDVICDRAEALILNEQYDEAAEDYQKALNINQEHRRAREGLNRAQKLLKQSKRRDYYKILGVRRGANKQEITKAYRKLAQKWHPDNWADASDLEKKKSEQMFIDIASAKEVLTDPEKRQIFDNGEDPLDPETQKQQHNPFAGGFPFGGFGGGHSFKFHFQ